MIGASQIQEILAQYRKHGWTLRRVLLCAPTRANLTDSLDTLFGETQIVSFETDAVWFSRPSGIGREAWELRRLTQQPFALIEVFEDEDDEAVREEARHEMEEKINGKRKMIF